MLSHKHQDQFSRKRIFCKTLIELSAANFTTVWRRSPRAHSLVSKAKTFKQDDDQIIRENLVPDLVLILHHQQLDDGSATRNHIKDIPTPSVTHTPSFQAEMRYPAVKRFYLNFKSNKMYAYKEWSIIPICGKDILFYILERH